MAGVDFFTGRPAQDDGSVAYVFFRGGHGLRVLGESEFLIKMGIVAVGVVVLGIMLRMRKPAPKD